MQPSSQISTPRLQAVDGTFNLRDIGGYRAEGGSTAWRRLYRSDGLFALTDAGLGQFQALGIQQVMDLRDDEERERAPSRLPAGTRLTPFPIFPSARAHVHQNLGVNELTELIFTQHAKNLVGAVSSLASETASSTDAVLVHCTAGKDRTGAVIALTLSAVGVDRDDVLQDYAETEKNLAGPWLEEHLDRVRSFGVEVTDAIRSLIGGSPIGALEQALKSVEREYGSVRDYLIQHGLSDAAIERLHRRLVEPGNREQLVV